ncbi:MAG: EamA family transporter [Nocardioidaceae bacterium]|nr:EamA family transporter [Nocardioidaceae bacterium]
MTGVQRRTKRSGVIRDPQRGYALVATGAALFVLNAGVSRVIQAAGVDSMTLTTVRCTGTSLVLLALLAARRESLRLPRSGREVAVVIGFGISGVALVQYFYFVAIDRLPVGVALLLEFTAPLLVALFARVVYRERVRSRMWLGMGLSLGGLALVAQAWGGLTLDAVGVLAGLGAAVSLACYFLLGEHSVTDEAPLHVLTKAFLVAAVFWNVVQPVTNLWRTDLASTRPLGGTLESLHAPLWLLIVWMVALGTVVPFLAELSALRHLSATEVTLIGMVEPVGAALLGWLWFSEAMSIAQLGGVVLVLTGIGLAQTARIQRLDSDVFSPQAPLVGGQIVRGSSLSENGDA